MPRQETSRLKLSQGWLRGEDWWGDPVSANFILLDMLLNPVIRSMTEAAPPAGGIATGDMYIVAEGGAGAWLERDGQLALATGNQATPWIFAKPTEGVRARLKSPTSWIWFNGETWLREDQNSDEPIPLLGTRYDIAMSVGYEAEAGEVLLVYPIPEPMTLPATAAGSRGRCVTPPNGILRLSVRRNWVPGSSGTEVGTITFAANSVFAIFTVQGDKPFATNDLLTIHMPDNPPAGFANFGVTLRLILATNGGN